MLCPFPISLQVSASTGQVLWQFHAPNQFMRFAGTGPFGDVYLTYNSDTLSTNSTLYAVNGATGTVRWTYNAPVGWYTWGSVIQGLVSGAEGVYIGTLVDNYTNLTALDVHAGAVMWGYGRWILANQQLFSFGNGTIVLSATNDARSELPLVTRR